MSELKPGLYVWVDQDLCTGDGLCAEICPELFFMADDGLAYVKFVDDKTGMIPGTTTPKHKMGGNDGLAFVPDGLMDAAVEAAEECPGECIFFTVLEEE